MPLPETIPVKYTEEEAEYVSVRPVVRRSFRLDQLLELVLCVTGKDPARIAQILRAGTLVFHYYRYWWPGFEAGGEELAAALEKFPDADPARPFRAEACTRVMIESGAGVAPARIELQRDECSRKRLFSGTSFWDGLVGAAAAGTPAYANYDYAERADVYRLELSREQADALRREAARLATREVRARLGHLPPSLRLLYLCPRES